MDWTPYDWHPKVPAVSDPWPVCPECCDARYLRVAGSGRRSPCPTCATECPECEGVGCVRGEDGPDPCNVCAGVGFARIRFTKPA